MNKLQNEFYDTLIEKQQLISIYLSNGVQLKGVLCAYEDQVLFLENSHRSYKQMIYKHAISTVMPWTEK
jgi:RNA chaperone Hfq